MDANSPSGIAPTDGLPAHAGPTAHRPAELNGRQSCQFCGRPGPGTGPCLACRLRPALASEPVAMQGNPTDGSAPSAAADGIPLWPPGSRYRMGEELARGGMGIVYRVLDCELGREVAMKFISGPSRPAAPPPLDQLPPLWVDRFVEEAQITAQLDHPAIVTVHDFGMDPGGRLYFTMKRLRGPSLDQLLVASRSPGDTVELAGVVRWLRDAATGVAHAHSQGIVHCDLKPQHLMLGESGPAQVLDWGVAVRLGSAGERRPEDSLRGTPAYLAPEQVAGCRSVTAATDVYSLGAILYERLMGHAPYRDRVTGWTPDTVRQAMSAGPPSPPKWRENPANQAGRALATVCTRAIARNPEDRWPDAGGLCGALERWLDRFADSHTAGRGRL